MTNGNHVTEREQMLQSIANLLKNGYTEVGSKQFSGQRASGNPIFAKNYPAGTDIYGVPRKAEFILYHQTLWPDSLAIKCRWQKKGGTTHQKFPFDVASIERNKHETIIVLDGDGYRPEAQSWLKGEAGKKGGQLLHVFTLAELSNFQSQGKI